MVKKGKNINSEIIFIYFYTFLDEKKKKPPANLLQHHPPPEEISSKFGPLSSRSMELKEVDTTKLSASLGLELEVFYKELQSR